MLAGRNTVLERDTQDGFESFLEFASGPERNPQERHTASDYGFDFSNWFCFPSFDSLENGTTHKTSEANTLHLDGEEVFGYDHATYRSIPELPSQPSTSFSASSPLGPSGSSDIPCLPAAAVTPQDTSTTARLPLVRLQRVKCLQCPQSFADSSQLRRHLRTHKSVQCVVDGCTAILGDMRSLARHKLTVHKDLFPSPYFECACGHKALRKDHYVRHSKACQQEKKRKSLTCS